MSSNNWLSIVSSQVWSLPFAVIYLIGIVLAIAFWRRHPAVSLLSLLAFSIFLVSMLLGVGSQIWLVSMADRGGSVRDSQVVFSILSGVRALFQVVAWSMLLAAVFGWRDSRLGSGATR